jgi:Uncharacterised nucleotidyltransferase
LSNVAGWRRFPIADTLEATEVLRLAGFGLPGRENDRIEVAWERWRGFLASLASHRLTGIALAAAESGSLAVDDGQLEDLVAHQGEAMLWALAVERKLLALADRFTDAGIEVVALKGPTIAHTVYPDPSWRPFGDLDLLVRTADWRGATALLRSLGYVRAFPEPRPGFDERFGKAVVHSNGDGIEIDLHRTLAMGAFGVWIRPDDLFRRTTRFSLGGRAMRRLDDTALLLHACVHATLGWNPPLLWPLRDVLQIAHRGRVDWEEAAELSRRWKLRAVLHHAMTTGARVLDVELPAHARAVLERERPTRKEEAAVRAYLRPGGADPLNAIRAIRGIRARVAYARMLLFPSREFLAARQGTERGSYLRRWTLAVGRALRNEPSA